MKSFLASALWIVVPFLCSAQTQPIAFEVASIKVTTGPVSMIGTTGGPGSDDPGRVTFHNMTLAALVSWAYDVRSFEVSYPKWADSDRYNIIAKIPEGTTTRAQVRLMTQELLRERFKLVIHHEQKEMAILELSVGKNGHKMREAADDAVTKAVAMKPGGLVDKDGYPQVVVGRGTIIMFRGGKARMNAENETMAEFAVSLSNQLRKPVKDATGLTGKYFFILSFVPENFSGAPPPNPDDDPGPSIVAAVQQQLGLRLESKKSAVDTIVVDSAEKTPTEN